MRFNRKALGVALIAVFILGALLGGVVYAAWSGTKTVSLKMVVKDPDQGCGFKVSASRRHADIPIPTRTVLPGDNGRFFLYVHNTGECDLIITDVTISDGFEPFELVKYEVQYTDYFPRPALGTDGEDYAEITIWYSVPEDTPPGEYQFTVDVTCERAPLS